MHVTVRICENPEATITRIDVQRLPVPLPNTLEAGLKQPVDPVRGFVAFNTCAR
jgi:hypothetical protein